MIKQLPDTHVRTAIYAVLNNIVVDGNTIPVFDSRVSGSTIPDHFILMSTQTNEVDKATKCEYRWESSILIDVVTTYFGTGNPGSRLLADDIMNQVRSLTNDLVLDPVSTLVVERQTQNFPNDIVTITPNENVFRKLMRLELTIN